MLIKKFLDSESPRKQYPPPKKMAIFWEGVLPYFVNLRGPVWAGRATSHEKVMKKSEKKLSYFGN